MTRFSIATFLTGVLLAVAALADGRAQNRVYTTEEILRLAERPARILVSPTGWIFTAFYHSGDGPDSSRYFLFRSRGSLAGADTLKWYAIDGSSDFSTVQVDPKTGILFNEPDERTSLTRSTDNGASWDTVLRGKLEWAYYVVDESGTVFATFQDRRNGIVYSTDHGTTWRTLQNTPSVIRGRHQSVSVRGAKNILRVHDSTIVTVLTGPGLAGARFEQRGVYFTSDDGKSWRSSPFWREAVHRRGEDKQLELLRTSRTGELYAGINVLAERTHKHEVSPNSHPWYIAHGFELARSTNAGKSWQYVSRFIANDGEIGDWGRALLDLRFGNHGTLFALTPDGVHRSRAGQAIEEVELPGVASERALTQDGDGTVYAICNTTIIRLPD